MKKITILFFLILSVLAMVACENKEPTNSFEGKKVEKIIVSKGSASPSFISRTAFSHPDNLDVLLNSIEKVEEIDTVPEELPEYNFIIMFQDNTTKEYHLWLRQQEGIMMEINNKDTVFSLSQESTNQLKKLIKR